MADPLAKGDVAKGEAGKRDAGRAAVGEAKGERDRDVAGGWPPDIEESKRDNGNDDAVDGAGAGVRLLPKN